MEKARSKSHTFDGGRRDVGSSGLLRFLPVDPELVNPFTLDVLREVPDGCTINSTTYFRQILFIFRILIAPWESEKNWENEKGGSDDE